MQRTINALIDAAEQATKRAEEHAATLPKKQGLLPLPEDTVPLFRVQRSLKRQEFAAWLEAAEAVQDLCDYQRIAIPGALHHDHADLLRMAYVPYDPLSETGHRTGFPTSYLVDFCRLWQAGKYVSVQ